MYHFTDSQSLSQQLKDFNAKANRLLTLENAASIEPKSVLQNMFTVIKDFSNNLSVLSSSCKFLFYKQRNSSTSSENVSPVSEVSELLKSAVSNHKNMETRIQTIQNELDSSKSETAVLSYDD